VAFRPVEAAAGAVANQPDKVGDDPMPTQSQRPVDEATPPTSQPPASPRTRQRDPLVELVVVPRSAAIQEAEDFLSSSALVALVVGTRPSVTPAMVLSCLHEFFGIAVGSVSVRRTAPDDFIARFDRADDLQLVLSTPWPAAAPFALRWRRWSRLFRASAGAFHYRVLVGMKGVPAHARSVETPQIILSSSCANVEIANPEAVPDPDDEREIFVAGWCAHPDLVPDQKLIAIPEPVPEHDGGPPLFLRPWEIIHDEVPALRYLVRIRLVEFQDWHTPPPSSDDEPHLGGDEDSDSGDSNFNGYHPCYEPDDGNGGGRRPRTTRFGGVADPRLGPGSGPACRPRGRAILVGEVLCPEMLSTVTAPCRLFGSSSRIPALGQSRPRPCLGVLAQLEAPREAPCASRSECTGAQKDALRTRSEGTGFQMDAPSDSGADLELWSPGSPSSVKSRADPMLDESCLCTPLTRQEDSLRTPHSIEAWVLFSSKNFWQNQHWPCVRDSMVAGRGLVGAALDFEPELLLGRIKLT